MSQHVIRLLIASDIPDSLAEIEHMLSMAPDMQVIGSAMTAEEVIEMAKTYRPDIVVMDYDMPGLDGAEATRTILRHSKNTQVVMLSLVNDVNDIRTAMRAGARDYLIKPLAEGELVATINWLVQERREYARMHGFVGQLRKAYEALFRDDKPVPPKVVAYLEAQVAQAPDDRLTVETLAVAYARNRDWVKLAPLAAALAQTASRGEPSGSPRTQI